MNLQEQINNDIKNAMKSKETLKLEVLRFIKSLFILNNTSNKPTDDLSVVVGHMKKLQDSLTMYAEGTEHHTKLLNEIAVVKQYLPQELTETEVIKIIADIKSKGAKDMGAIMKELQPQIKGRFDGKKASDLVKAALV
jgi:uncharacterized protein YqeY